MKSIIIYNSTEINRTPPVNYDEMNNLKYNFISFKETIQSVKLIHLKNVYVSPFGIVYKNINVIKESVYSMYNPRSFYLSYFKKLFLKKVININDECTIAHNSYFQNYYHWLLEAVPRLFLLKDKAHKLSLVLNENSPSFINQYVSLFGFKNIVYIPDDYLARVKEISFTTFTSRGLAMHEPLIKEMAEWLLNKNNIKINQNPTRKIFITRKYAKYRRLLNEDEVINYLTSINFEILTLEDYTISEQMKIFNESAYVIGTQGAGMANLIYAFNCKLLITIIHEEHQDEAYFNQTNMHNTPCYYFQCKGAGTISFKNNDDITADLVNLKRVCDKYIVN